MIAKHSHEQSQKGEGVEVVTNEPCEHPKYGKGQFTEKRIHLSRLFFPLFYITCTCTYSKGLNMMFSIFKYFYLLSYCTYCKLAFTCSKLPAWIRSMIPQIFYITEKAWNYYPHTETGKLSMY